MPRRKRSVPLEWPVHVTNRANDRRVIFRQPADYASFVDLLVKAGRRFEVDLLGYCVMPNHFHLVLSQRQVGAVSAYLHWVCCCSACNFREATSTRGMGHVYQRRFWCQVLSDAPYYLAALRYVEANALRARLVWRAEDWQWGSLWERATHGRSLLAPSPVRLPDEWRGIVNGIQATSELEQFRFPKPMGRPRRPIECLEHALPSSDLSRLGGGSLDGQPEKGPGSFSLRSSNQGAWPLL